MGVTIGGSVQTGYVTLGGEIQGGAGAAASGNAALGDLGTEYSPDFLYLFDGDITDSSGNGRDLTIEAGSIDSTDSDASGYLYAFGSQWLALNGATNLIYDTDDATLRNAGELTIFAQIIWSEQSLVDGWIVGYGKSGATEADNWQYALLCDAPSYEFFQEQGAGIANAENLDSPLKSHLGGVIHTICVRRSDNLDGTWNVDWFFNGQKLRTDTFTDSAEPTGGTAGRLRVGGYDGGGYMEWAYMRNLAGYMSALTDTQIVALHNRASGLAA